MSAVWEPAGAHLVYSYHSYPIRRTLRRHTSAALLALVAIDRGCGTRWDRVRLVYLRAAYQSNTRKARSVFHRLGRPSPSSISTGIAPGYCVSSGHRPSASRFDATSSIASATRSSGCDASAAQVLESPQHVVMPPGREGEARPHSVALAIPLDHLAGRPPAEETALEEVLLPAETGLGHRRRCSRRQFVLEQRFQHADRGVERRARRAVLGLAVPAAVGQLLAEQPVDDAPHVLAEVGAARRHLPVDARLHLAGEEGIAVALPAGRIPATSRGHGRGPPRAAPRRSRDRDPSPAAASGRASWSPTRGSTPRRPTARRPPGGRAVARPALGARPVRARPRPPPRAHRSGRAGPASGSRGQNRAATL